MNLSWTKPHDLRHGWLLWAIFILIIALLGSIPDHLRTVVPNYHDAAIAWLDSGPLYSGRPSGFLYFPQSAICYIPFALLPDRLGEAMWRIFCLSFLAGSLWRLASVVRDHLGQSPFLWVTIFTFPVIAGMARNGQMTTPLLVIMILACVALIDRRYTLAAAFLLLGLALKPLILVLMLLLIPLYPRMVWRLGAGLLILLVLPFAMQTPAYVLAQYKACWHELSISAYPAGPNRFVDVFHLLAFLGLRLSDVARLTLSLVAGVFTLGICFLAQRRQPRWFALVTILAWSVVYLMLFNPRVEHNTYGMIAPIIALFAFVEWWGRSRPALAWTLIVADLLLTVPPLGPIHAELWMRQTIALAFAGYLLCDLVRQPAASVAPVSTQVHETPAVASEPS